MIRRTILALGVAGGLGVGLGLLGGACSPQPPGPEVATVGGPADDSPGTTAAPAGDPREAALEFARCMREHGVDMPDPDVSGGDGNGPGEVRINIGGGPGDVDAPAMKAAQEACQPALDAAMQQAGAGKLDPAEEARMHENALRFAQCMRDHGVDMPDPTFAGGGVQTHIGGPGEVGSGPDPDSPVFRDAQKACEDLLGKGGPQFHTERKGGAGGGGGQ
jgi:hypothetical protein